MIAINVKRLCAEAKLPTRAHATDAGWDLYAASRVFDRKGTVTYGTGIAMEIPEGHVGLVFPRSSVANKDLNLSNSVGVIDAGYRGEITVRFRPTLSFFERDLPPASDPDDYDGRDQTDPTTQYVSFHGRDERMPDVPAGCLPFANHNYEVGERVAQIIIMPFPEVAFQEAASLSDSERGTGGYGSTGNREIVK